MSEHGSPVENSGSDVSGPQGRQLNTAQKLGLVGLIAVVALGFIWFNFLLRKNAPPAEKPVVAASGPGLKYTPPPADKPPSSDALPLPATASTLDTAKADASPPPIFAYSGGGMASGGGMRPAALGIPMPGEADTSAGATSGTTPPAPTAPSAASHLAQALRATTLNGTRASLIKNPDMMITEGTLMPCIMDDAVTTQTVGFVTCHIPIDVRGTTGNVVLLDRGTKIVGQVENGLQQGQDRAFVLWTRAETPNHVIISFNAPAADELGRTGLPGAVDYHWWQRFGGALMLTVLQGGLNAGTALAANSGNGNSNQATVGFVYGAQSNTNQIANTALENSINIPNVLYKNQGDTASVFVAQDLDFASVYRLSVLSSNNQNSDAASSNRATLSGDSNGR